MWNRQSELSSKQIANGHDDRRFDRLEIKPFNSNMTRFNQLIQVWKDYDIPVCHQKYYYNVLLEYQQQADELMRIEIDSIINNKSVVRTLHQLTLAREKCILEIQRLSRGNYSDIFKIISKFIYDLRKLTLNLIEFHRKWINFLNSKVEYKYIWKIQDRDYLHQIKEDHKLIQNNHPKMKDYFELIDEDIFYLSVVRKAENEYNQKHDYLIKHKIDKLNIDKIIDLQNYFNKYIKDNQSINLGNVFVQNSDNNNVDQLGQQSRKNIDLANYAGKVIYTAEDIEFNLVSYPFKDLQIILENWQYLNVQELNESFKYPINHIKDLLMYWQEAVIIRINQNGLLICSVDQEFNGRRWNLHSIYLQKEQKWQSRLNVVIQNFIQMLIQKGDTFTSLAICCSNDQYIKKLLIDLNFQFSKTTNYDQSNVIIYEQRIQNVQHNLNRKYFTPFTLRMLRIYAKQIDSTLITNEELLIAQYCANLGKNQIIKFENNILALSPFLNKSKLYGQEYMLIQKPTDVKIKYQIEFNTPIQSPVYFQLFNVKLNFKYFSSEIYKNTTQPYLRLTACPNQSEQDPSILQLFSSEIQDSTIYLISTIDPFIKIFIQEVKIKQISKSNIQTFINQTFEKFDKKQVCQTNIWLPQFKCYGKQLKLNDASIEAYFQNDTSFQVQYPRISALHTNKLFIDSDKVISPPFLFGIVQSDLEQINKPLFSILIDKEHLIKTQEITTINTQLPNPVPFKPRETESLLKELLKNTVQDIKKSFCSDPSILIYKLQYSLECSLINLNIGHALIYVDENHIFEKRWIIETIMINDLNHLSQLLSKLISYIFTIDAYANEIQISQTHYQEQGEIIANKFIMDSIKKSKFRWRQVDNDAKTQIRKTIYFLKRSIQDFPNKIPNQVSIQFRSYYATQQSEQRNQIQNQLELIKTSNEYKFFEDCFQSHVNGQVSDDSKIPNTEFVSIHSLEQLQAQIKFQINLPKFENKFDQFDILQMNTQLRIKKQRQINYKDKKYLEIPNHQKCQQIFEAENKQLNQKIYFLATQDPLYFMYFMELGNQNLKQQIQQNSINVVNKVFQAFQTKNKSTQQLIWIEQFQKMIPIHQKQNYLHIDFGLNLEFTIEQTLIFEQDPKNEEEIHKIKLPLFFGLIYKNDRTKLESPLIGTIID